MNALRIISKRGVSWIVSVLLIIFVIGVFLLIIFFIWSPKTEQGLGGVEGIVYAPNGIDALSNVKIYLLEDNNLINFTNGSGYFIINQIPSGKKKIIFEQGSFKNELDVDISPNTLLSLKGNNSIKLGLGKGASIIKMAVVRGSFDSIELILEELGFEEISVNEQGKTGYVLFNTTKDILANETLLNEFSILFLNCGTSDYDYSYDDYSDYNYSYDDYSDYNYSYDDYSDYNYSYDDYSDYDYSYVLEKFVSNGGSIYASDWEYYYLMKTFPTFILFYSPNAKRGFEQNIQATIVDSVLRNSFGKEFVSINFDLPFWVPIRNVSKEVSVIIKADNLKFHDGIYNDVPLMTIFSYKQGIVFYTSFHNEAQKTEDIDKILKTIVFKL
jgi:hypothetical protein